MQLAIAQGWLWWTLYVLRLFVIQHYWWFQMLQTFQGWLSHGKPLLQDSILVADWRRAWRRSPEVKHWVERVEPSSEGTARLLASQPLAFPAGRASCNCRCAGSQPSDPEGRGQHGWEICDQFVLADWPFLSRLGDGKLLFSSDPHWPMGRTVLSY